MSIGNFGKLIITIGISELAGVVGVFFTAPAIPTWYAELAKPALDPPAWVFGPVWTTLYFLMGVAAFLVWQRDINRRNVKIALGVFVVQLALNALWSILFFGMRNPGVAFIEIIFLWVAISATIVVFAKISRSAAWLLVPYIAWVSFAAYLNYVIWTLNSI